MKHDTVEQLNSLLKKFAEDPDFIKFTFKEVCGRSRFLHQQPITTV